MSLPFDQKIYVSRNVVIQRYPVGSGIFLTYVFSAFFGLRISKNRSLARLLLA